MGKHTCFAASSRHKGSGASFYAIGPILLVTALSGCGGGDSAPADPAQLFTLGRNSEGIALIQAPALDSAAAGLGYAYAQDNFCLLQDYLLTVNGERSKYLGPDTTVSPANTAGPTGSSVAPTANLTSDLFYKFYVDGTQANKLYDAADQDTKDLLSGYVAGVNRYINETPAAKIDPACQGKPWLRPMTPTDAHRIMADLAILASGSNFIGAVVSAKPPAAVAVAHAATTHWTARKLAALKRKTATELGLPVRLSASNGWAFGRDSVEGSSSLLFGNPHFPWATKNRFYQARMTVPGILDVTGAALGGVPIVQIGYNKDFAWTHTVSTGKRFTIFELALKPGDPLTYIVDGVEKAMLPTDVTVEVLSGATVNKLTQRFYRTDFGPVMSLPSAGLGWSATRAYALADVNLANNRMILSWLRLGQAKSVRQAQAALSATLGIPWVNTIASDSAGEVMYGDISPIPNLSAADIARCAPSPGAAALLPYAGLVVLNGATASCKWGVDATTPAPGLLPASKLASAIRTDYVANSNDSYWLANPAIVWPAFSPMLGATGTPQRERTRAALNMFQRRLAGTDGLPGSKFTAEKLKSLWYRSENFMASTVLDDLLGLCPTTPAIALANGKVVQTAAACAALSAWDRRGDLGSKGAHVFREFWRSAMAIPGISAVAFDPANPVTTPRGLNVTDTTVRSAVLQSFGKAIDLFQSAGVALDATLGSIQYATVKGKPVAVPGGDEFEGVLNKQTSQGFIDGHYQPFYGTSYVQLIDYASSGASAQGILVYSQSTDPGSPYFDNQLPFYSQRQLLTLPTP